MISRLFLILALALIPWLDAMIQFPEPVQERYGASRSPAVQQTRGSNADMAADTRPTKGEQSGVERSPQAPAAIRTTDTQFRPQGATADSQGNDAVSEELRLGAGPSSPAHQQSLGSLVLVDSYNREGRRMRAPQDAGESDLTRVRTSDRSKEAMNGLVDTASRGADGYTDNVADSIHYSRVARNGLLTFVHPDLAGGLMRDGVTRYDPQAAGLVAANSWPIGTLLEVRGPTGRSMMLEVRDTGGGLGQNHLDTSEADFQVLVGDLAVGVAPVEIRGAR